MTCSDLNDSSKDSTASYDNTSNESQVDVLPDIPPRKRKKKASNNVVQHTKTTKQNRSSTVKNVQTRGKRIDFKGMVDGEYSSTPEVVAEVQCPICKVYSDPSDEVFGVVWYGCDRCDHWWHRECLQPGLRATADLSCMDNEVEFICPLCKEEENPICAICLSGNRDQYTQWERCDLCLTLFHVLCFNKDQQDDISYQRELKVKWYCYMCNLEE